MSSTIPVTSPECVDSSGRSVSNTGQGRKTDATVAHSVAVLGTRMAGLRPVVNDEQVTLLRILVDRRAHWARTTPGWSPSCINCSSS
jgi:hypothetical protein